MSFNPNGQPLSIKMKFGGNNFAVLTLKLLVKGGTWQVKQTFDSRTANQSYDLDPTDLLGQGKTISDFSGSSIGWFYVADDPEIATPNVTIDYKFDMDILQGTNTLDTFSAKGIGATPLVILSKVFTF
jgi:hypothetical protein